MKLIEKADNGKSGAPKIKEEQRAQDIDTAFMKFTSACVDNPSSRIAGTDHRQTENSDQPLYTALSRAKGIPRDHDYLQAP